MRTRSTMRYSCKRFSIHVWWRGRDQGEYRLVLEHSLFIRTLKIIFTIPAKCPARKVPRKVRLRAVCDENLRRARSEAVLVSKSTVSSHG